MRTGWKMHSSSGNQASAVLVLELARMRWRKLSFAHNANELLHEGSTFVAQRSLPKTRQPMMPAARDAKGATPKQTLCANHRHSKWNPKDERSFHLSASLRGKVVASVSVGRCSDAAAQMWLQAAVPKMCGQLPSDCVNAANGLCDVAEETAKV